LPHPSTYGNARKNPGIGVCGSGTGTMDVVWHLRIQDIERTPDPA
jgi:hypothetical protein